MLPKKLIAYRYDGTADGLLCCIFRCFSEREIPQALITPDSVQMPLFPAIEIETIPGHAQRVAKGIGGKIGIQMLDMLEHSLLCELEGADLAALEMACLGFDVGGSVCEMLTEPCVEKLNRALKHAYGEAHLLTGFVRFREISGALIATIAPKNRALPLIEPHFCERFAEETFMIYDEVHKEALIHRRGQAGIYPIEHYEPPPMEGPDAFIASLWQQYFDAIAIKQRENPKCQRTHMPKRYWAHMVEMQPKVTDQAEKTLRGLRNDPAISSETHP